MKNRWSLREQNRGASLIAVLAAIVFVGVIGMVITQITITNIQMKEMEQLGKKNFYNAETVLDDLAAGLNSRAAGAMQKAYMDILSQYQSIVASGANTQEIFRRMYMNNLIAEFATDEAGVDPRRNPSGATADTATYEVGYYSLNTIKDSFTTKEAAAPADPADPAATAAPDTYKYAECLKTEKAFGDYSAKYYRADFQAGTFVLEGIKITAEDEQTGYVTTICTDIVFKTPNLSFDKNALVKNFMRYSLVADHAIDLPGTNLVVDGNVYAGHGGINTSGGEDGGVVKGTLRGNIIVTRGDITVSSGHRLIVGNGNSKIYAENVRTKNTGASTLQSQLTLDGYSYIADDLELDGRNCLVTLKGYYYGYNFQKNYGGVTPEVSSQYSSAIAINGKDAKLNMENLNYLLLAGRTYLQRTSWNDNRDVPLGESLSVRSNQVAYYVPEAFLYLPDDHDKTVAYFVEGRETDINEYFGVSDIYSYVNKLDPVTAYFYQESDRTNNKAPMYYLKFKSESAANSFFADYYQGHRDMMNSFASLYVSNDAIQLKDGLLYTLRGDLMYSDPSDNRLNVKKIEFQGDLFSKGAGNTGEYYVYAGNIGASYKGLELYLDENDDRVAPSNIRFENDNKANNPLLAENLIKMTEFKASLAAEPGKIKVIPVEKNGVTYKVVLVDGDYSITDFNGGIVIATGNVTVGVNMFSGLIMAGKDINFANGGGAISANEALVSQLFAEDAALGSNSKFAKYFVDYNMTEDSPNEVSIDKYMSYDNWTKTIVD